MQKCIYKQREKIYIKKIKRQLFLLFWRRSEFSTLISDWKDTQRERGRKRVWVIWPKEVFRLSVLLISLKEQKNQRDFQWRFEFIDSGSVCSSETNSVIKHFRCHINNDDYVMNGTECNKSGNFREKKKKTENKYFTRIKEANSKQNNNSKWITTIPTP